MAIPKSKLSAIERQILRVLKDAEVPLDIEEIRARLPDCGTQQHLDRRVRSLDPFHVIERSRDGRRTLYRYRSSRPKGEWAHEEVSKTERAAVLDRAKGRCQMCGRSVEEDAVVLHIDHKIPQSWGGTSAMENLWAICSQCNEGKKHYYASFSAPVMEEVLAEGDVHSRIARLLSMQVGEWIESDLIEFVANFDEVQADWQKRLRELRYTGAEIEMRRQKRGRRHVTQYRLVRRFSFPNDLARWVKEYERRPKSEGSDE